MGYCCGCRSSFYMDEPLLSAMEPLAHQMFELVPAQRNYEMASYMQVLPLRQEYLYTASFSFSRASLTSGKAPSNAMSEGCLSESLAIPLSI